jgi:ribosome-binding factor A
MKGVAKSIDPKKTIDDIGGGGKRELKRSGRVAEAIRQELATLFIAKVQDPRLHGLAISRVEVNDDLSLAWLFFTLRGGRDHAKEAEKGLRSAKGFLRSHLAKTLNLRFTPDLAFRYDDVAEKVAGLEELFQEIADERDCREDNT